MPNYQNGKIYKIVCNITGLVYIGSTTEKLSERLWGHVYDYNSYLDGKRRCITSSKVLEGNNFQIELLEDYPCDTKIELHVSERYYTQKIDCVNKIKNQGLLTELGKQAYHKQYHIKYDSQNREKIREKQNRKYACDCDGSYTYAHKKLHVENMKHEQYIESLKYETIRRV